MAKNQLAEFLAPIPEAPKGGLERLLETVDRPGRVVRALLQGEGKLAGKNLLNLLAESSAMGLYRLSDLPFGAGDWYRQNLDTSRKENKKLDWGFGGNIITDPLSYVTLGGAGVAKNVAAAGAKEGGKALARRALQEGLTKAGKAAVETKTDAIVKMLAPRGDKLIAMLRKANPELQYLDKDALLRRVAKREVLGKMLTATPEVVEKAGKKTVVNTYSLSKTVAPEHVEQGGIKAGIPWLFEKTIPGTAGVDALKYHPAAALVGAISKVKASKKTVAQHLGETFVPGYGLKGKEAAIYQGLSEAEGARLAAINRMIAEEMEPMVKGLSERDTLDVFTVLQKFDPEPLLRKNWYGKRVMPETIKDLTPEQLAATAKGVEAATERVAKNPKLQALISKIEKLHDAAFAEEKALGLDEGYISQYLRRQYTPQSMAAYLEATGQGAEGFSKLGGRGFIKGRKFETMQDALKAGLIPEINPIKAVESRLQSGVRAAETIKAARKQAIAMGEKVPEGAASLQGNLAAAVERTIPQPRGPVMGGIASFNRLFKPAATSGFGPIPNPSFVVRNLASGLFQGNMDPDIGLKVFNMAKPQTVRLLANMDKPEVLKRMDKIGDYTAEEVAKLLRKHNVTRNTFAETELLTKPLLPKTRSKSLNVVLDASSRLTQGSEAWMRGNAFIALLKSGVHPADAARRVQRVFVNYQMASPTARNVRDIVPFAQFSIGTLPPLMETLARRPRFATPARELYKATSGDEEAPMPEWMSSQPTISAGTDKEGNRRYVTQLGTIFEQLNIPQQGGFAKTINQSVLGALTPTLKIPAQIATNRDFFFGGDLSYGKTPRTLQALGAPEQMDPRGRALLGLNPYSRQVNILEKLIDERKDWVDKVVNLLTGVRMYSVDERRELSRQLENYLKEKVASGDVGVLKRFFNKSLDPEIGQLIKDYNKSIQKKKAVEARSRP